MITKQQAQTLSYGAFIYSLVQTYRDKAVGGKKQPVRVRAVGRFHALPEGRWRLPIKYGMSTNLHINPRNAHLFTLSEQEAVESVNAPIVRCQRCPWEGHRLELLDGEACPQCKLVQL